LVVLLGIQADQDRLRLSMTCNGRACGQRRRARRTAAPGSSSFIGAPFTLDTHFGRFRIIGWLRSAGISARVAMAIRSVAHAFADERAQAGNPEMLFGWVKFAHRQLLPWAAWYEKARGAARAETLVDVHERGELVLDLVERVRARGIPAAVLSNSLGRGSHDLYEGYDLDRRFDAVVISDRVGLSFLTACCLFLVPWIVPLAMTLPKHYCPGGPPKRRSASPPRCWSSCRLPR
jgi:hypothetical protein